MKSTRGSDHQSEGKVERFPIINNSISNLESLLVGQNYRLNKTWMLFWMMVWLNISYHAHYTAKWTKIFQYKKSDYYKGSFNPLAFKVKAMHFRSKCYPEGILTQLLQVQSIQKMPEMEKYSLQHHLSPKHMHELQQHDHSVVSFPYSCFFPKTFYFL